MNMHIKLWNAGFANDNETFIPEVWAAESLMILENNMVAGNLVHRDFADEIANFGDVVNTRKPAKFSAKRKTDTENVTIQDATAANVAVPLNQHVHTSFMIRDGERSKSFKNLVAEYLNPAVISMAEAIDQILLTQVYRFPTAVGKLGTDVTKQTVIDSRVAMNTNLVPMSGRNMIVTPNAEGSLLNISEFINAEKIGDDGTALREGSLGRKFGLDFYMCQQTPSVAAGSTIDITLTTTANAAVGATVISASANVTTICPAGTYFTLAGDATPQLITASEDTTDTITFTPGLKSAVASGAVITAYAAGAIDGALAVGAIGDLDIDGFTVAPKGGQLINIAGAAAYGTINTPKIGRASCRERV